MRARLVSTEGEGLEAVILVEGRALRVMDGFGGAAAFAEMDIELSGLLDDDETWEDIFSGNPDHRIALEPLGGWRYRAYGRIVGVNPVRVDCGLFVQEGVVATTDERVVGDYVAFTITRLDARWPAPRTTVSPAPAK